MGVVGCCFCLLGGGLVGEAGLVIWSGGWPGGRRRMDLRSKECSGVNIVTKNI